MDNARSFSARWVLYPPQRVRASYSPRPLAGEGGVPGAGHLRSGSACGSRVGVRASYSPLPPGEGQGVRVSCCDLHDQLSVGGRRGRGTRVAGWLAGRGSGRGPTLGQPSTTGPTTTPCRRNSYDLDAQPYENRQIIAGNCVHLGAWRLRLWPYSSGFSRPARVFHPGDCTQSSNFFAYDRTHWFA